MQVTRADPRELRPHPRRALVPDLSGDDFAALRNDIEARGIQTALQVTEGNVVLCGHHRLRIARELDLPNVPVVVVRGLSREQQVVHLVLDNLHRRHVTPSQRAAILTDPEVAAALLKVFRAEARQRQIEAGARGGEGGRGRRKTVVEATPPGKRARAPATRDRLGQIAGVSGRTIDLALLAWEREPDRMREIVHGVSKHTVTQLAHEIRRSDRASDAERAVRRGILDFEETFRLQLYDVWNFASLDPGFGKPWPGNIPASLVANLLYYFTEPGDLVVDPMAGGGVTGDVCRALGREVVMADIDPSSRAVKRHAIEDGPAPGTKGKGALVFLDPPYWGLKGEGYTEGSSSALPWPAWKKWLRKMARSAAVMAKPGGHVACLMQDSLTRDVGRFEPGRSSIVETIAALGEAELVPVTTIACPLSTQQASRYDVEWARGEKRILGINRLLVVYQRPGSG